MTGPDAPSPEEHAAVADNDPETEALARRFLALQASRATPSAAPATPPIVNGRPPPAEPKAGDDEAGRGQGDARAKSAAAAIIARRNASLSRIRRAMIRPAAVAVPRLPPAGVGANGAEPRVSDPGRAANVGGAGSASPIVTPDTRIDDPAPDESAVAVQSDLAGQ